MKKLNKAIFSKGRANAEKMEPTRIFHPKGKGAPENLDYSGQHKVHGQVGQRV